MTHPRGQTSDPKSIFQQPWWLEATVPGLWRQATVVENGETVAGLPFVVRRRNGLRILTMPALTQSLGPWLVHESGLRLAREKRLFTRLIEGLPAFDVFSQNFHPSVTNWQPFYWKGFTQTTYYTYVIPDLTDLDRVYAGLASGKKSDINRARRMVVVKHDLPVDRLYGHLERSLRARGLTPSYPLSLIARIYSACVSRGQGRSYYAEDANGNVHAANFVVWDQSSAYFLVSSVHPEWRSSGAGSYLLWEAIRESSTATRQFNFEGSMVESYERSYRAFGGIQTPYSHILGLSRRARALKSAVDLLRVVAGRPSMRL